MLTAPLILLLTAITPLLDLLFLAAPSRNSLYWEDLRYLEPTEIKVKLGFYYKLASHPWIATDFLAWVNENIYNASIFLLNRIIKFCKWIISLLDFFSMLLLRDIGMTLVGERLFSSVPPSKSVISVLVPWRAFWVDITPFKGPSHLVCCFKNYREIRKLSGVTR